MKLTPGEIYFIGERDKKTGKVTQYVKIGIVRDGAKDIRTSSDRLIEHQTGNPRGLFLHQVIATPAVEEIETRLHRIFATSAVSGEWFQFSSKQLTEAILKTTQLRDEVKKNLKVLQTAETLKLTPSNGETKRPSAKSRYWYELYVNSNVIMIEAKKIRLLFRDSVLNSAETEEEVGHLITTKVREGSYYFDEARFAETSPAVYKRYLKKKKAWKQRFSVKTSKSTLPTLSNISPKISRRFMNLEKALQKVPKPEAARESLHHLYLEVLKDESMAFWDKQIAEAQLKAICADYEGIEEICTWTRSEEITSVFDSERFESENPRLFKKFQVKSKDVKTTSVIPRKGY